LFYYKTVAPSSCTAAAGPVTGISRKTHLNHCLPAGSLGGKVLHFGDGFRRWIAYIASARQTAAAVLVGLETLRGQKRSEKSGERRTMKKFLLSVVGLIALGMSAPASAADLPAAPYAKVPVMIPALYDWSGFYTGLNGGWGSSHKCWNTVDGTGAFIANEGCHNATGGFGGAQLGYRWGVGSSWIFGVEGQGDWSNLRGSNVSLTTTNINNSKIDAFGLITGQVGYAFNTVLLYVKGGGAVTDDRFSITAPGTGALVGFTGTQTRWGGTAGAGVEFSFAPNWSTAVEYDHLFMGTKSTAFTSPLFGLGLPLQSNSIRQDVDIVSVRVNYRWGGPVIAKY
jgi:outer membrane immunogenic protein